MRWIAGEVDATQETALKDKYNVKGYPTILFFRDSKQYEYTHARTTEGFMDFVKRMTSPWRSVARDFNAILKVLGFSQVRR